MGLFAAVLIAYVTVNRAVEIWRLVKKAAPPLWGAVVTSRIVAVPLGLEPPYATPKSESGIAVVSGILAAAVTQVGALCLNEKSKDYLDFGSTGIWFYEFGNLLLLGMVSGMLRATKLNKHGVRFRSYDSGTRCYCIFAVLWIIVGGMITVPWIAYAGHLPTQTPKVTLKAIDAEEYEFESDDFKGMKGVSFKTIIKPSTFDGGVIPDILKMKLRFAKSINSAWRVSNNEILVERETLDAAQGKPIWVKLDSTEARVVLNGDYWNGKTDECTVVVRSLRPNESVRLTFKMMARERSNGFNPAALRSSLNNLTEAVTITAMVPASIAAR